MPECTQSSEFHSSGELKVLFWTALSERLAASAPWIQRCRPRPQYWQVYPLGSREFRLITTLNSRVDRLGVDLSIYGARANEHFANLVSQWKSIESALGFELDWHEYPQGKAWRAATWYGDAPLRDRARWGEYLDWMAPRLVRMEAVLRPLVDALPRSLDSAVALNSSAPAGR